MRYGKEFQADTLSSNRPCVLKLKAPVAALDMNEATEGRSGVDYTPDSCHGKN